MAIFAEFLNESGTFRFKNWVRCEIIKCVVPNRPYYPGNFIIRVDGQQEERFVSGSFLRNPRGTKKPNGDFSKESDLEQLEIVIMGL